MLAHGNSHCYKTPPPPPPSNTASQIPPAKSTRRPSVINPGPASFNYTLTRNKPMDFQSDERSSSFAQAQNLCGNDEQNLLDSANVDNQSALWSSTLSLAVAAMARASSSGIPSKSELEEPVYQAESQLYQTGIGNNSENSYNENFSKNSNGYFDVHESSTKWLLQNPNSETYFCQQDSHASNLNGIYSTDSTVLNDSSK
ncbi:hypothetical protein Ciccas_003810 [Cichlidogyrus casuarinus]|uniref:Uncharacterized protein n=1 Tax=Cichlidogyrus casuarinus TaxID=1844966 RepID=A0ABD2QDC1_9PLAT